ncbi:N-acetylglucosamine-6-phosphate deacetylase [archaeon]|nr:MAG: N-acetylglucosamine-6-phosphate deacetylase [archaeon]
MLPDGVYTVDKLFTGQEWRSQCCIIVENCYIRSITDDVPPDQEITRHYQCLVPALIDLQIYGAYGKLLAEYPDIDSLHKLHKYCSDGKADFFMPTVATNTLDVVHGCIDAVRAYWSSHGPGCLGLHLEGPWISIAKRGAHTIEHIQEYPSVQEVRSLLDYGQGIIKIITLAPEICSNEVLELIRSYGVVISAGHSDATYDQATRCFDQGPVTTVTHLYNAMSLFTHRAPGLVGAVFNHPTIRASVIADGYHVDYAAISIANKVMGPRLFLITDAVTHTTTGNYPHILEGDRYVSNGILSGSALTMERAVRNIVANCRIPLEEGIRMGSMYPAQVVGLGRELGRIEVGYRAAAVEWEM